MAQADRVHSTPPTNTSATNPTRPVDPTRRGFITLAAGASIISVGSLAAVAMPIAAAIPNTAAATADHAYALIAEKLAADAGHSVAIDAQDEAESDVGIDPDAVEGFSRRHNRTERGVGDRTREGSGYRSGACGRPCKGVGSALIAQQKLRIAKLERQVYGRSPSVSLSIAKVLL
jgi:hypothetical protein